MTLENFKIAMNTLELAGDKLILDIDAYCALFDVQVILCQKMGMNHDNACNIARHWSKITTHCFYISGLLQGGEDWLNDCIKYPTFVRIPNAWIPANKISRSVVAAGSLD